MTTGSCPPSTHAGLTAEPKGRDWSVLPPGCALSQSCRRGKPHARRQAWICPLLPQGPGVAPPLDKCTWMLIPPACTLPP